MENQTENKNQNVKELTDEQLKQVAGGGICPFIWGCKTVSPTTCECQECNEGWTLETDSAGVKICILGVSPMIGH